MLFPAFGFAHADFYHLSNRRSAAPGYYYLLVEHSKRIFDSVIAAIEDREPVLVVLVQHPPQKRMGMGEFLEILDRGYVAVREFVSERGGTPITVYRRRPEARRDAVAAAT